MININIYDPGAAGLLSVLNGTQLTNDVKQISDKVGNATIFYLSRLQMGMGTFVGSDYPNTYGLFINGIGSIANNFTTGVYGHAVSPLNTGDSYGVGLLGTAYTNGSAHSFGVRGHSYTSDPGDIGVAYGGYYSSISQHAQGNNIGLYGEALNGVLNYAFQAGHGGLSLEGTQGDGFIRGAWQQSSPVGLASTTTTWWDTSGRLNWCPGLIASVPTCTFDATGISASRVWTLPNATTTIAGLSVAQTFSALQTFTSSIITDKVIINGTGGAGYLQLGWQSSSPSTTGSGTQTLLWADNVGKINWRLDNNGVAGYTRTFDATGVTANRTWTLPDATTTLAGLSVAQTFSAAQTISVNSVTGFKSTGTWLTSGAQSTPMVLIDGGAATTNGFSANGTGLGINAASGFTGNLADFQVNGSSKFSISYIGEGKFSSVVYAGTKITIGSLSSTPSLLGMLNTSVSTSSPYSTTGFGISQAACTYTSVSSGTIAVTGVNTFAIPSLSVNSTGGGATTLTEASTIYIAGAPTASSAGGITPTITHAHALHIASGDAIFEGNIATNVATSSGNFIATGQNQINSTGNAPLIFGAGATTGYFRVALAANSTTSNISIAGSYINSYSNLIVGSSPVGLTSGSPAWLNNLTVKSIGTVSGGTLTSTNTASLYIDGASSTGANNYALYVNSGTSYLGGLTTLNERLRLKSYTVATLPAGTQGDWAYVTDALAPAYLVTIAGGGTVKTPVFYDGTNWVAH